MYAPSAQEYYNAMAIPSDPSQRSARSRTISVLLAGFIAGFIWMAITVLVGGFGSAAIVGGGFAFLVGTALLTFVIAWMVSRSKA